MCETNFKSIHGVGRSRRELKYLEKGKTGGGIGDTGSWGVASTQELQDFIKESQNHHQGILGTLHALF
jgi:hypothetical protein